MDLTPETLADGSLADQLRYWKQQLGKVGPVKSVTTGGKTVVYDHAFIENRIALLEKEIRGGAHRSRIVHTRHARR